jgi:hypothetical protein
MTTYYFNVPNILLPLHETNQYCSTCTFRTQMVTKNT